MSKANYLIGTRGSMLAVTQCSLLKEEIESLTDARFELKKIKTEGDQKVELPLWQMEGKDFFTKELDAALVKDEIDLVVHSYKDLGSERPEGLKLAAIGKRSFAHDILLIKKAAIPQIKNKKEFIVGTSSPRRIVNVEASLKDYLPGAAAELQVKCKTLRGNVNTRIQKLLDGQYDAIVLALAGLERLASKEDSRATLSELLRDLTFLIMPQKVFPSSASQGALAVEIHERSPKKKELLEILDKVHHPDTVEEVRRERKAFLSYGGGCHLAVGIHVKKHKDFYVHIQKGSQDDAPIDRLEIEGVDLSQLAGKKAFMAFGEKDPLIRKEPLEAKAAAGENLFVTSHYCFHALEGVEFGSLWAAGKTTHQKLAKLGHWVNGSADGFGHEEIVAFKNSKAVQIMLNGKDWTTLSHDQAKSPVGKVLGCYTRTLTGAKGPNLEGIDVFYWGSFLQYQTYVAQYPQIKDKIHVCGLGKTYDRFVENNIEVLPAPELESFLRHTTLAEI